MTVRELLNNPRYGVRTDPLYCEKHVEIRKTIIPKGEKDSFILTEKEAVNQFGDRSVWLAFHSEGTYEDPVHGEHVYVICIDKNG